MKLFKLILSFTIALFATSCITDNEEEVFAKTPTETEVTDTTSTTDSTSTTDPIVTISYTVDVKPILTESCTTCHTEGSPLSFGIALDNYDNVIPYVNDGSLLGVINHSDGYSPMPSGSPKLLSSQIEIITNWVNEGVKEN